MEVGFLTYDFQKALGFALPVLFLSLISTALVVYGWYKKNTPMGHSYSTMLLALTLWLIFYSLRVLVEEASPQFSQVMAICEFIIMVALPLTWVFFSINFAGKKKWFRFGIIVSLLVIPSILMVGAIYQTINYADGLLSDLSYQIGLGPIYDHGWVRNSTWFYLYAVYSIAYFIFGTVLIIRSINTNERLEKKQVSVLFIGVLIPWVANIILLMTLTAILNFVAPLIFVLSGVLLGWGIYYNHFITIINLAHKVLIDRMGDGLVILDKQDWILEANQVALTMFQSSKSSIVGHPVNVLYLSFPELENIAKQLNVKNHEISVKVGQKTRFFNTDVIPLYGKQRVLAGKIIVFREITTLKETYQNLEKAKSQAEKADTLKSAFLANLSHEIKTPMNAIIGFSNLLNDASIAHDERQEFIEHISNSGSTLLQLIDDIMDISKLDAGQFSLKLGVVDLSKMMAELFARYNDHMLSEGKTGIDLILGTKLLDEDLLISADGERIRQIVTNLLSNAVKFTKQGQIEFGYHLDKGTTVQFYVKDTGIGIPFDKHKMIFERFGRVYTANKQEYSGTGLGLALSRGMVRLMGGHIWFESIYGKGSTFYFSVPYDKVDSQESEAMHKSGDELVSTPTPKEKLRKLVEEPKIVRKAPELVIPEPTTDLDAESDPYLDYLFATTEEESSKTVVETKEEVKADGDAESTPILDAMFEAGTETKTESASESDLIFEPEHTPTSTIEDATDFSGSKILVVDYDDMSYLFIEMILRPTKVQIIRAKTFQQAMNLLKGGTDLTGVLLTSEVPDIELVPGIKVLRSKYPRYNVIAVTPFASEAKRKECLSEGCLNVIPKPVKQRELLAAVQNLHTISNL